MPDPDSPSPDELRTVNLEATFADRSSAERAIAVLERAGLDVSITIDASEDERAVARAEMRDELEASIVGPGPVGPFTKSMTQGIAATVTMGVLVGAVAMLLIALIAGASTTVLWIMVISGATAGAVAGFVVGGYMGPRLQREGQDLVFEEGVTVGIHASNPSEIEEAARFIRQVQPIRLDRVDATGRPVTTEPTSDTRPLRGETPT